jgi:pimeloyl-ACP methyl ester carboxylesterase
MSPRTVDVDGVGIAYDDVGEGDPVVLVHGFASRRRETWAGWPDALVEAGYRVLALDVRGHGESDKPHDPAAYGPEVLAGDVAALLDDADVESAHLVGYSMGARISMHVLLDHPERVERCVLAGVGERTLREDRYSGGIADALTAEDPAEIEDPTARQFRTFAAERGNDLEALAACRRATQPGLVLDAGDLAAIETPVLVAAGAEDELVGDPAPLANALPDAESLAVPGRDHLSTTGDRSFREAVLAFLDGGAGAR